MILLSSYSLIRASLLAEGNVLPQFLGLLKVFIGG